MAPSAASTRARASMPFRPAGPIYSEPRAFKRPSPLSETRPRRLSSRSGPEEGPHPGAAPQPLSGRRAPLLRREIAPPPAPSSLEVFRRRRRLFQRSLEDNIRQALRILTFPLSKALVTMAADGTYMGMMNETLGHNGLDWDGLGNPPEEQQDTHVHTTPTTQGNKKARNKNFCEVEDVVLVRAWLDTSIDAIPGKNKKKVLSGLGFIIFTILRKKSQFIIAQILYHIVGELFKRVSISSVVVLPLLRVEIKVGRHLKTSLWLHVSCTRKKIKKRSLSSFCTAGIFYAMNQSGIKR